MNLKKCVTIALVTVAAICSPLWAGGRLASEAALPSGFAWGSFVSAHSTEGGHTNDWTAWEGLPGHTADGSVSGPACNGWELFAEDQQWMKKFSQNTVIISLEWSKIEPNKGVFDEQAIAHYRAVFESLKAGGIKPIVVLWDHTLPTWEAGYGGFENPLIILDFQNYATQVAKKFGDLIDTYVSLNDPVFYANKAFKDAIYPPGKADLAALGKAQLMMLGMHAVAWQTIHANDKASAFGRAPAEVGLIAGLSLIRPSRADNPLDVSSASAAAGLSSRTFIETLMQGGSTFSSVQPPPIQKGKGVPEAPPMPPIEPKKPNYDARKIDFLIVHYKGLEEIKFNVFKPLFVEKTVPAGIAIDDAGQAVYPEGLTSLLLSFKKYPIPMFVMAGIADSTGDNRGPFLSAHVNQVRAAILQGCQITGFFYTSLLSGFEYEKGYSLRRGLLNVNTQIQERQPAKGADVFSALAKSNGASDVPKRSRRATPKSSQKAK